MGQSSDLNLILKLENLESDCLEAVETSDLIPDVSEPQVATGPSEVVTSHQMLV